ncbi:electron transport complex, RnfABCDGE type, G subunit [Halobacteroides halobius DSM 5150]|uniref:Ion-translocating oxidoreductase complex subunit G n=1 Tax=Halobacteroides halobius (strain ATCC 35273 / DSM 5150 / MD-1) TaxID=748449 RepID=L0KCV6_HALHC|nr:RnfABCDGE type electron transport complex subunit G [Halobacteroides halobius]AGB41908.1 electron transport complex, RnfABCDGE type, G subunit [Halobacteroides halobius DSM 5150]
MAKIKPRLIIVLTLIMIVSALVLTYVYQVTTPIIKAQAQEKKEKAILDVLPGAIKYKKVTKEGLTLYKGIDKSGNTVGYAVQNSGQGFQSIIKLMIGMDLKENKIIKINILSQAETPGLGSRITEKQFKAQFQGKSFSDAFKAKKDVDAITGATISSQALSDVLDEAIAKVQQVYGGGE